MKYYKNFNSIDKFNDWYLKNNYVEPNIIVIKEYNDHGEEISTTVDYNNEMLTLVYDTSLDKGTQSLWTTYNGEIYDMIYIDNQLVKNTMNPILSSNLSKGKHVVKIKFKNKNIIGNNAPIIYNPYLIKANIPNSVTTITANAFNGCSSLTDINIPDSVTTIGSAAFSGCYNLESVIIGNSVTAIGSAAFSGCQLKKITFGKGLTQLNSVSNYGINTSSLEECNILSNITELPEGMFNNCNYLTKVTLPNSLITIGTSAFYYCSSLTSINIPDSVTSIGTNAFSSCYRLTSITIPNSVTSIDTSAFSNSGLIELNIPDSVTNIGGGAFSGCQLKKITFGKGLTQLNSVSNYGINTSSLEECNILSNITELPDGMFSNYSKLTKVTLPNSLTTIASGLFYYCYSLTSITIPNSVTSIGNYAFYYCSSLTSITIPDSVTSIGYNVFNGCTKLFYTVDNIYYFDVNNNFGSFMTGISDRTQTSYAIKEGTTRIDADIPNLPNAVSFTLPSTLEEIRDYSLDNVATILTQEQLEYALDININCISTSVKHQVFGYVENGIKYYYDDTTEKLELIEFTDTTLTSYTIKNGVNVITISIPQLPNAQSITIPNTITSLANNSFDNIANILTKQQIESLLAINNKSISYVKLLEYYYTKEQLSNEYFTVYNSSNSYLYLYWYQKGSGEETDVMQYSSDNGVTWNTMPDYNTDKSYISIAPNNKRIFKSTLTPGSDGIGRFECSSWGSSDCFITGNIMSLLYGDNYINQTSLSDKQYVFKELFYNNSYIKNAKYLILPATTLANYCYEGMFKKCTSLTTAPQLPAITLADYCYYFMFYGCTNLTTAPELPATTLANSCYERMFVSCTSLITAPELPATTLASSCYSDMFASCTSLITTPELPVTTLPDRCYSNMFASCTSLTTAPELPATTLAYACYYYMFGGCTSLTTAPELPATTLASSCYEKMFKGCTSLTTVKQLPATTLASSCYSNMFEGCTSLTSAPTILPATTLAGYCCGGMFKNCTSLTTAPQLPATTLAINCYRDMFEGCTSLTSAPALPATTLTDWCYYYMFQNCTSLTSAPALPATTLATCCYEAMFWKCTSLTSVTELPATTLVERCYQYMFYGCTSLTTAPKLPATTLAKQCYMNMFYGCTSLTTAPILPATTLSDFCYDNMFYGCTSLNNITMLATNISANSCLWNWVSNVATTGTFYKAASMTKLPTGVNGVPSGWNIQEYEIRPEPRELPEGYTEVKYIASTKTGGQYIDLNILLYDVLNKNYDIAMKFNIIGNGSDNDDQPTIFGCQDNTGSPWPGTFIRRSSSNVVGRYIGGSNKDNTLGQLGNIIELTEKTSPNKNVYNYNNSGKVHSWGTSLFCAFADANGTPMRQCEARIYYFKLFVEGTLVRDLVPCINSSNVPGFYDVVNDIFYTSLSNTPFIYEAYLS